MGKIMQADFEGLIATEAYWKIMRIVFNVGSDTGEIDVWGFASEQQRRQPGTMKPFDKKTIQVDYDRFIEFFRASLEGPISARDAAVKAAYSLLSAWSDDRAQPFFINAIDVIDDSAWESRV
jgi:hypothetical protein